MDEVEGNPPTNRLPGGVSEETVLAAIEASGYGLQSVAVDKIIAASREALAGDHYREDGSFRQFIDYQEEWAYVDADSDETRQLDALVMIDVGGVTDRAPRPTRPQETLRYSLDLLIECKQSELPFVFFMRPANTAKMPRILGLPHEQMSIKDHDSSFTYGMIPYDVLGFYDLEFARMPPSAISMSKAQRKSGTSLTLSGEDVFRGIALPLSKAVRYYEKITQNAGPRLYFNIRIVVPIAVVRAPMIGVSMDGGHPAMTAIPWVRLVRLDPGSDPARSYRRTALSIDVVHVDYIEQYVGVLLRSAREMVDRIQEFAVPILSGRAISLPSRERDSVHEPEDEVHPYKKMRAILTDAEFMKDWERRFVEAHRPKPAQVAGPSSDGRE